MGEIWPDECRYCRPHTASPRKKRAIASSRKPSEESREKQSLHGAYSIAWGEIRGDVGEGWGDT